MIRNSSKLNNSKKLRQKIEILKAEISEFQKSIRDSSGKLPKKFFYSNLIVKKVKVLGRCGISASDLALELGLSKLTVTRWFGSTKRVANSKKQKLPVTISHQNQLRELKVVNSAMEESQTSCARIAFGNELVFEFISPNLAMETIRWIREEQRGEQVIRRGLL